MDVFPPSLTQFGVDEMDNPDWGLTTDVDRNVEEVKLGDGYVAREVIGINALQKSWAPTWSNLDPDVAEYLYDWLEVRFKIYPFQWTHPVTKVVYQVICQSLSINYDTYNNAVLDAKFDQDFNPVA